MNQYLFLHTLGFLLPTSALLQLKPLFFSVCSALGWDEESRENSCHPTVGFQKSKSLGERQDWRQRQMILGK